MIKTKPSNFNNYPFDSVLKSSQCETVAKNIMTILARTGDKFRDLSWEEYKSERIKDGNFIFEEKKYFDRVIIFCKSADTAYCFSADWYI